MRRHVGDAGCQGEMPSVHNQPARQEHGSDLLIEQRFQRYVIIHELKHVALVENELAHILETADFILALRIESDHCRNLIRNIFRQKIFEPVYGKRVQAIRVFPFEPGVIDCQSRLDCIPFLLRDFLFPRKSFCEERDQPVCPERIQV